MPARYVQHNRRLDIDWWDGAGRVYITFGPTLGAILHEVSPMGSDGN